jgi:predicted dehydrogenase
MSPLRIGLVGAGSMGAFHARVVANADCAELAWVADPDESRRTVAERYGSKWIPEPDLGSVDAVVVATPTHLHREIALEVIAAGLPLLLEKPLADSLAVSTELVEAARAAGTVLMCGLVERFNPAVRTVNDIVREPVHASAVRHSPYAERVKTGVAQDLLIHDVDMLMRLFGSEPMVAHSMRASFDARSGTGADDMVEATLRFDTGALATASVSRLAQRKVRILRVMELGRAIDVDLMRQSITVYRHVEHSVSIDDAGYQQQTIIEIPVLQHQGEPLMLQLQHFVALADGRADAEAELASLLPAHRMVEQLASPVT